ncbi:hypothetical protein [Bifidobacterium sp.]|uniref:hypothetical protein n=1 Tax=Bifidobacterium sp. TaxID=41200 RepID=UPI0039EA36CD
MDEDKIIGSCPWVMLTNFKTTLEPGEEGMQTGSRTWNSTLLTSLDEESVTLAVREQHPDDDGTVLDAVLALIAGMED